MFLRTGRGCSVPPQLRVEGKEFRNRHPQSFGHFVLSFEGRCVPATLDQAQEVHGNIQGLRKLLLTHAAAQPDLTKTQSKFLTQRRHLKGISKRQSPVVWLRAPPNEITGPRNGFPCPVLPTVRRFFFWGFGLPRCSWSLSSTGSPEHSWVIGGKKYLLRLCCLALRLLCSGRPF